MPSVDHTKFINAVSSESTRSQLFFKASQSQLADFNRPAYAFEQRTNESALPVEPGSVRSARFQIMANMPTVKTRENVPVEAFENLPSLFERRRKESPKTTATKRSENSLKKITEIPSSMRVTENKPPTRRLLFITYHITDDVRFADSL
jgi:hypothetical protein